VTARAAQYLLHEASAAELLGWDGRTVVRRRGHVYQSRAWAAHLARSGWRPRFLVFEDGFGVLAVERPWPVIGGSSSYVMRGPIPSDDDPAITAARLAAVADELARHGVDVVASDAEVPAETGYPALLAARGFHPIEEILPSRHRMSLPLGEGVDEAAAFAGIAKSTRQRIRSAERGGVTVVRHDVMESEVEGFVRPAEPLPVALDRFFEMLGRTGERRGFGFGPRSEFVPWWIDAHADAMLVHLEARADGEPIAGLMLYRHGGRLSTVHSADRIETRRAHPGALHLLRWRAIQLAIAESCDEMDLGGIDVPGERRIPVEGDRMYGLYQHKVAFGARWVEQSGAHERVVDILGYGAGRLAAAARRASRRVLSRGAA
jgi:hypothetical protein